MKATSGLVRSWVEAAQKGESRLDLVERTPEELHASASRNGWKCWVYVDLTGKGGHYCTCVDSPWASPGAGTRNFAGLFFCRHIVAVALYWRLEHLLMPLMALAGRGR